jgi:hypothetical protein
VERRNFASKKSTRKQGARGLEESGISVAEAKGHIPEQSEGDHARNLFVSTIRKDLTKIWQDYR